MAVDAALARTDFLGSEGEESGLWEGVRERELEGCEVLVDVGA